MYTLERKQYVKADLEVAWRFIEHPANLDHITPPDLKFQIVSEVPEIMYDGLIIEYRITIPWLGTQTWVTEIKHIRKHHSFVDEQRLGPYHFWYHYHELQREREGCCIVDRVHYLPPFGVCGKLLHWLYIRRNLEWIFDYRYKQLGVMLAKEQAGSAPGQRREEGQVGVR